MKNINKTILLGRIGKDPEMRATGGGARVAQLSLATSRRWRNGRGEEQEKTEWHRVVVWNVPKGPQLADICERYARKGDVLYVEGRVEYRSYERAGTTVWVTEIVAQDVVILGRCASREDDERLRRGERPEGRPEARPDYGDDDPADLLDDPPY